MRITGFGLVGRVAAITVLGRSASLRWSRMRVRVLLRVAGHGRLWPGHGSVAAGP